MTGTEVFQRVLEVGPNERGEGIKMVLLWDGADRGIVTAEFDGQEVTTDMAAHRLLDDIDDLIRQACTGLLQVNFRDEGLERSLRKRVNHG